MDKIREHFTFKESDITIITDDRKYVKIAFEILKSQRKIIESTIISYPTFKTTYSPFKTENPPEIIERMEIAAEICDVGPMAAIAGALADMMSNSMVSNGAEIATVENGGEIMIQSNEDIHIALYSMTTIMKAKVGFRFQGGSTPIGLGTSSGTFGHATSLGVADTVTVFAENAAIGDAAATRVANSVKGKDVEKSIGIALEVADSLEKVHGVFVTRGELVGKSGTIPELIQISENFGKKIIDEKLENILPDKFRIF